MFHKRFTKHRLIGIAVDARVRSFGEGLSGDHGCRIVLIHMEL